MTRADRVLSTPPTNTPIDTTTRRRFLTVAAGASVASVGTLAVAAMPPAAPASAACAVDPVFELIEIHRAAHIAHIAAIDLQARYERRYRHGGSWISEKPCCDEDDAFEAFVVAPATTMPGLLAKLAYFEELASEFETEWMARERADGLALIRNFAASLRNIGVPA
jgi:hypothetical protein